MAYKLDEGEAGAMLISIKAQIDQLLSKARVPVSIEKKTKSFNTGKKTGSCKYCNEEGLYWTETSNGWRLLDDEANQHKCDNYKGKR